MSEQKFLPSVEPEKKIITLEDLIDPTHSIPDAYKHLIAAQKREQVRSSTTSFSYRWEDALELDREPRKDEKDLETMQRFFKEHLKHKVLIDLGGGSIRLSYMCQLAKQCEAAAFASVDLMLTAEPPKTIQIHKEKTTDGFHEMEISADMLEFVTRLKDESVCFAINGIDWTIIDDKEYNAALAKEIVRATSKGGIIFGYDSEVSYPLYGITQSEGAPIKTFNVEKFTDQGFVFEKV